MKNDDKLQSYNDWFNSLEPWLKNVVAKFPPDRIYVIKKTGQKCEIQGFTEEGTEESVTISALILSGFNAGCIVPDLQANDLRPYYGEEN